MISSTDADGAHNINEARQNLQIMENMATALTVERMDNECIHNTDYNNQSLLPDSEVLHQYKINMEMSLRASSDNKAGFIVWLKLEGLPALDTIKPKVALPRNIDSICKTLKSAARRLTNKDDARFVATDSDTFCYTEPRLSKAERDYANALEADPFTETKKIIEQENEWHPLPISSLLSHVGNQSVSEYAF